MNEPSDIQQLGKKIAIGAVWITVGRLFIKIIGLINTLVLARILVPEDFGVIAIGVIITQLLQNISDIGVSYAVVRYQNAEDKDYDALFTLSLIRGLVILTLLFLVSPLAVEFYDDDRLGGVFMAMGCIALMQSLLNPKYFEFQRKLDFSKEFFVNISDKGASVIASIFIAYYFRTYWAIIAGIGVGAFVQVLISYVLRPYRPKIGLNAADGLFKFTGWLMGLSVVAALNNKIDMLILNKVVPSAQVGNYYVGTQLADLPSSEISMPIARALYPGLSTLHKEPERMRDIVLRSSEIVAAVALPACIGLAFVADDFVELVVGNKWDFIAPLIQWITPFAGLAAIYSGVHGYAIARGQEKLLFMRELLYFMLRTPIFLYATLIHGFYGAVTAAGVLLGVNTIFWAIVYQRLSGDFAFKPLWRARRTIAACLGMAAYFLFIRPHTGVNEISTLALRLFVDIIAGASTYVAIHILVWWLTGKPVGIERLAVDFLKRSKA